MKGRGLFQTGAGGSAPKHVQQFVEENHLRWDSLGEFLALAVSLDHLGENFSNSKASVLGAALDKATTEFLQNDRSPSRKVNEPDNRASHFYLALYWAQALAEQNDDSELKAHFAGIAKEMEAKTDTIIKELIDPQGVKLDIKGYYKPDEGIVAKAMRPSATWNGIVDKI